MLNVRGYIFSRPFLGERVPQHIQNIVIRDYCKRNNLNYNLSLVEYAIKDTFIMFNQLVDEIRKFDGVILYSLFQLPEDDYIRNKLCKKILNKKKTIFFANESREIKNLNDLNEVEIIWKIKKNIPKNLEL